MRVHCLKTVGLIRYEARALQEEGLDLGEGSNGSGDLGGADFVGVDRSPDDVISSHLPQGGSLSESALLVWKLSLECRAFAFAFFFAFLISTPSCK